MHNLVPSDLVLVIYSDFDDHDCDWGFSAGHIPSTKTMSPRHGVPKPPYMLPCRKTLSDQQMSELNKKVEAIQSKIPIYVAVMHNSNTAHNKMCLLVSHHLSVQC